jgi:hypothetical protein
MKKILLTIILIALSSISLSQNCSDVNTKIDAKYSYVNTSEDLEIPLNESWNIALENQKAVLVFFYRTQAEMQQLEL